jgi:assimilatory nitrate reductase catalytic subunit
VKAELDAFLGGPILTGSFSKTDEAPAAPAQSDSSLRLLTYRLLYDDGSRIRHTDGVREHTKEPFVEINPADADRAGVDDGQEVNVSSQHGTLAVRAQLSKAVREGVVFVPWGQHDVSAEALCSVDDPAPAVTVEPR